MIVCSSAVASSSSSSVERPAINQQAVVDHTQADDQRPIADLGHENDVDQNAATNVLLDPVEVIVCHYF